MAQHVLSVLCVLIAAAQTPAQVREGEPLESAAQIMAERRIGCLPVVDEGGRLDAILSESDLLQALVTVLYAERHGEPLDEHFANTVLGDLRQDVEPNSQHDALGKAFQQMAFLRRIVGQCGRRFDCGRQCLRDVTTVCAHDHPIGGVGGVTGRRAGRIRQQLVRLKRLVELVGEEV